MKNTFKRFVGLILSILIFASAINVALAETEGVSYDSEAVEVMEFLKKMEIIPSDYRDVDMATEVTRADFADSLAKIINATSYSGATPYFYDVPVSHWAYQSICSLAERGIIKGSENKIFAPEQIIKTADACKMLLTAMGYEQYAENKGGYPTGYLTVARRIDILDNVSVSEYLTGEVMIKLLYNASKTEVLETTSIKNDDVVYSKSEDTLLAVYKDIKFEEGVVAGANSISFNGKSLKSDEVEIGGKIYNSEISLFDCMGEEVEFFYRDNAGDGKDTVIWARRTGDGDVLRISADSDTDFDVNDFELTYYDADNRTKARTAKIARNVILVYNGGIVTQGVDKYFELPIYDLKLVKADNSKYNVAILDSCNSFVVGSIDVEKKMIFDKSNAKNYVNLDEQDYDFLHVSCEGLAITDMKDISVGDVACVFMAEDGNHLNVKISRSRASGTLDSYRAADNGTYVTVGGGEYFYPDYSANLNQYLGNSIELYLDVNKRIARLETKESSLKIVYLIGAAKSASGLSDRVVIKALDETSAVSVFKCADKVKIDGDSYKDSKKICDVLKAGEAEVKQQLVGIKINSDDEIAEIDTPYVNARSGEDYNTLQINVPRQKGYWRTYNHNGNMPIGNSTKIYVVPTNPSNATDDDYYVVGRNAVKSDVNGCYATSYKTAEKVGNEQYVVLEWDRAKEAPYEHPVIIEEIRQKTNEDGETQNVIIGYNGSGKVSLPLSSDRSFGIIEPGMIVRLNSYDNVVYGVKKITTVDDIINGDRFSTDFNGYSSCYYGMVKDVVDGVVKIGSDDIEVCDSAWDISNVSVTVYDCQSRKNKLSVGALSDIQPGDYVFVVTNYANSVFAYVIKQ